MKQVDSRSALGASGVQPLGVTRLPVLRLAVTPLVRAIWVPVALGAILVLAAAVRLYNLVENPPGFFADEASFAYNAYTILHTGKDEFGATMPVFFKSFGEYKLPVYIYSQVPFIAVLGLSELPVRLTTAAYGVATVGAVYFLMRVLFQRELPALATAAVLAISPWHIFYSRTGLGDILVHPFYIVLGMAFLVLGTRRPPFLLASGAAFVLALFSYRAAWVVTPPVIAVLIVLYHRELIKNWRFSLPAALMVALAGAFILYHLHSVDSDRAQDLSILSLDLSLPDTIRKAWENYRTQFTTDFLFETTTEVNMRHVVPGGEWVYVWQVPFLVIGVVASLWRPTRAKLLLLALLLIYPLPTASAQAGPSSSHTFFGSIAFTLLTGYGIATAALILTSLRWRWRGAAVGVGAAGVLLGATAVYAVFDFPDGHPALTSFLQTYHGSYRDGAQGGWGWQWGARDIMARLTADEEQYDELVIEGAAFNAADIFVPFYEPEGCAKCRIGHWDRSDPNLRQLFAMRPDTISPAHNLDVLDVLYAPNGHAAFVVAEIADGPHNPRGALPNIRLGSSMTTLDEFYEAMVADPNNAVLYVDRGNLFWRQGKFWDAIYDYNRAIELNPGLAAAHFNRGNVYNAVGIYDWATIDYEAAAAIDATLFAVRNNTGDIYNRTLDYQSAVVALDQFVATAPDLAIGYANRAVGHLGLAQLDLALADANRAIELEPDLALGHYVRGRANARLGAIDAAFADFSEAVRLDPTFAEAYFERGRLHGQQGRNTEAVTDLDHAIDLDRDFALGYAYRGLAYLALGDFDRGVANLDKAITLDRAFVNAVVERSPQYQWSLVDLDETYVSALSRLAAGAPDPASAERLAPLVSYLSTRSQP